MFRLLNCLATEHDYRLVVLAALVCAGTMSTALRTYGHISQGRVQHRWLWLILSGLCAGCGIWATHFIGMLAYQPRVPMEFHLPLTVASLLAAIVVTTSGFAIANLGRRRHVLLGGGVIGIGISLMHFVGMAAVEIGGGLSWDRAMVVAAIIFGVAIAVLALSAFHELDRRVGMLVGSGLLVLAVGGMHFTAMAAAVIFPDPSAAPTGGMLDRTALVIAIAAVIALVLPAGGIAIFIEQLSAQLDKRTSLLRTEIERRREAQREIEAKREVLASQQGLLSSLMTSETLRSAPTDQALKALSRILTVSLGVDRGAVLQLNESKTGYRHGSIYVAAADTFCEPYSARSTRQIEAMLRLSSRQLVAVDDVSLPNPLEEMRVPIFRTAGICSVLHAPVSFDGRLLAFLTCSTVGRTMTWTPEQKLFAAGIANLAALVLERQERRLAEAEVIAGAERLTRQQMLLNDLMLLPAIRNGTPVEALRELSRTLSRNLAIDRVGTWLLARDGRSFRHAEVYSATTGTFDVPLGSREPAFLETVVRVCGSQLVAVEDTSAPHALQELKELIYQPVGIRAVMHVPILVYGKLVGFITCASMTGKLRWTGEHKLFATSIGNLAALMIERNERQAAEYEVMAAADRLMRQQTILSELMRDPAVRTGSIAEALRALSQALSQHLGIDRVGTWLIDKAGTRFTHGEILLASNGTFAPMPGGHDGAIVQAMIRTSSERIVAVDDTGRPHALQELQEPVFAPLGIRAAMHVPIVAHGNLVGFVT